MPSLQPELSKIIVVNVVRMLENLQPTYNKLLKRRKIPENAQASVIFSQYFPALIDLHQDLFRDVKPLEVAERLRGTSRIVNYCHTTSTVLLLAEQVVGVTLVLSRKHSTMAYVYAVIINSHHRRSWATVYLKYHSLRRLLAAGIDEIAFQAFAGSRDTLNHARKVGARIVADNYSWS
ncbi:MAG: hypothetical protein WA584_14630 [Pyrinomonadaceae bacterium]